ncbi:hypothetical protein ABEH62_09255 [Pantoea eucalypti]|uniref:hypothetical protein n=1 Tax=Pantoea eucalypti TaxID=470933 RepID=UPI0016549C58|nr:hypothetical protein [Pantoea eucalypti]
MEIKVNWERQEQRFARGENLMVGKWCVGSISPDVVKSEHGNMCVYTDLPGLKKRLKNRLNTEQAKAALENAVAYWFAEANLNTNSGATNEQTNR